MSINKVVHQAIKETGQHGDSGTPASEPSPESSHVSSRASRDSTRNIIVVAVLLSLVCSVLVSGTAILLRPLQLKNEALNKQKIILEVAGLLDQDVKGEQHIEKLFAKVEAHVVDLARGVIDETLDPVTFDALEAGRSTNTGISIPASDDTAKIGRRAKHATVYLVRSAEGIKTIILPVYGYGLWSTMYGFLALENDANTIAGLRFYEQTETPGLGGEVDNPRWRAQWKGKLVYDQSGVPKIEVIRGSVDTRSTTSVQNATAAIPLHRYQVDGLAGSTLTGRGVTNLMHYWLGEQGFGPYLAQLKDSGELR